MSTIAGNAIVIRPRLIVRPRSRVIWTGRRWCSRGSRAESIRRSGASEPRVITAWRIAGGERNQPARVCHLDRPRRRSPTSTRSEDLAGLPRRW